MLCPISINSGRELPLYFIGEPLHRCQLTRVHEPLETEKLPLQILAHLGGIVSRAAKRQ